MSVQGKYIGDRSFVVRNLTTVVDLICLVDGTFPHLVERVVPPFSEEEMGVHGRFPLYLNFNNRDTFTSMAPGPAEGPLRFLWCCSPLFFSPRGGAEGQRATPPPNYVPSPTLWSCIAQPKT